MGDGRWSQVLDVPAVGRTSIGLGCGIDTTMLHIAMMDTILWATVRSSNQIDGAVLTNPLRQDQPLGILSPSENDVTGSH